MQTAISKHLTMNTHDDPHDPVEEPDKGEQWTRADVIEAIIAVLAFVAVVLNAGLWYSQQSNFRRQTRAWVGLTGGLSINIRANETGRITLTVKNTGPTPALNTSIQFWHDVKARGQAVSFQVPAPLPMASRSVIFPGETRVANINVVRDFTPQEIGRLTSGDITIYVLGRITYEDVFDRSHTTDLCLFIREDLVRDGYCDQYNAAN